MKAAVVNNPGGTPEYADFADPAPIDGRELVQLVASGIHPIVRSLAAGRHYGSAGVWPMIPGVDAVARTSNGELVYTGYPTPPYGTLAERISVPGGMRLQLPAGADPVRVAAGLNPGLSSWLPLTVRAREVSGLGTVLVLGATGMAGLLAVQNARVLGADRVVAAGRSEARLARAADCGAAATARLTGDGDADAEALTAALDGASPSLVLDYVWGPPAESAFRALGRRGLSEDAADIAYVQIGAMAGPEAAVPSSLLRSRRIRITGSGAGSASTAEIMRQLPAYIQHIADGVITVPARVVPLSQVAAAWTTAHEGGDRVVVVPG
jgi:NADPH:quinone reductase-like Zn-dependent oxidoreductase